MKALLDAGFEPVGGQELAERLRGGGEAARDADARRGQGAHHFTERGVLAADSLQVRHAEIFEPGYAHCLSILSSCISGAPCSSSPTAPASPRRCSGTAC